MSKTEILEIGTLVILKSQNMPQHIKCELLVGKRYFFVN
jgi:hypothetical protein